MFDTRRLVKWFFFFYWEIITAFEKDCFYTVEIGFKVEADPALLALAYAVSIAEERHPAANDFVENELMDQHYNDCVTTKKRFISRSINMNFSRCEVEKRENVKTRKFRVPGTSWSSSNAKASFRVFAFSRFRVFEAWTSR